VTTALKRQRLAPTCWWLTAAAFHKRRFTGSNTMAYASPCRLWASTLPRQRCGGGWLTTMPSYAAGLVIAYGALAGNLACRGRRLGAAAAPCRWRRRASARRRANNRARATKRDDFGLSRLAKNARAVAATRCCFLGVAAIPCAAAHHRFTHACSGIVPARVAPKSGRATQAIVRGSGAPAGAFRLAIA